MADALFPVFDVPDITEVQTDKPEGYSPSAYFDFEIGDFKRDGAYKVAAATGQEAYIQWCLKVVMTERDSYLAYSSNIGVECEAALAEADRAAVESALEKTITEALMVNTITEYVRNFQFKWSADALDISMDIKGKEWLETVTITTKYTT